MDKLKVPELREELRKRNLDTEGEHDVLVQRLEKATAGPLLFLLQFRFSDFVDEKAALIAAKKSELAARKAPGIFLC